jgi:hypothetical protein
MNSSLTARFALKGLSARVHHDVAMKRGRYAQARNQEEVGLLQVFIRGR